MFALVGEELVGFVWGGADGGAVGTGGYWSVGGVLVFVLLCLFLAGSRVHVAAMDLSLCYYKCTDLIWPIVIAAGLSIPGLIVVGRMVATGTLLAFCCP